MGDNMEAGLEVNYASRASREYFESILNLQYPLTATDQKYLAKIKLRSIQKKINEAINMPLEQQEKLLDHLTDLFKLETQADIERYKEIAKKIGKSEDFKHLSHILKSRFDNLEPSLQKDVVKDTIIRLNNRLRIIYQYLDMDVRVVSEKDLEKLVIIRQVFYECLKLGIQAEKRITKRKKIDKDIELWMLLLLILLLKLESARRGKISFNTLYDDLSLVSNYTTSELEEERIGTLYEVLGINT